MKIAFRVDASDKMGSGHFMRCLTLANVLKHGGHNCKFLFQSLPEIFIDRLKELGHQFICLRDLMNNTKNDCINSEPKLSHSQWLESSQLADAAAVRKALKDERFEWMIVDNYALDALWEREISASVQNIMVIDDLADRNHTCQLLLDQNFYIDGKSRYDELLSSQTRCLMGPQYALLMPDYAELHKLTKPRKTIQNVLIYFGGADRHNMTGKCLNALSELNMQNIEFHVIVPIMSAHIDKIKKTSDEYRNVHLKYNLKSLAPLLAECDFAIGAIGATSWERLCLGVPTLAITTGLNQRSTAADLHTAQLINLLGKAEDVNHHDIAREFEKYTNGYDIAPWSKKCLDVCDGIGANRVAKMLEDFSVR